MVQKKATNIVLYTNHNIADTVDTMDLPYSLRHETSYRQGPLRE